MDGCFGSSNVCGSESFVLCLHPGCCGSSRNERTLEHARPSLLARIRFTAGRPKPASNTRAVRPVTIFRELLLRAFSAAEEKKG